MNRHGTGGRHTFSDGAAKHSLRLALRQRRKSLVPSHRRHAARKAALFAAREIARQRARRVAVYLPMGSELSTMPLIALLRAAGIAVFVPALRHGAMRFRPLRGALAAHPPGMAQPRCGMAYRARAMDVVLLPLLGFDAQGQRLGQGGGWYDRTLARCRFRPYRLGFAYSAQQVDAIPAEDWDVRLHAVATERKIRRFPRSLF